MNAIETINAIDAAREARVRAAIAVRFWGNGTPELKARCMNDINESLAHDFALRAQGIEIADCGRVYAASWDAMNGAIETIRWEDGETVLDRARAVMFREPSDY